MPKGVEVQVLSGAPCWLGEWLSLLFDIEKIMGSSPIPTTSSNDEIGSTCEIQILVSKDVWVRVPLRVPAAMAKWFIRAKLKISSVKSGEGSTPSCGTN